jgi:hypothetical protein
MRNSYIFLNGFHQMKGTPRKRESMITRKPLDGVDRPGKSRIAVPRTSTSSAPSAVAKIPIRLTRPNEVGETPQKRRGGPIFLAIPTRREMLARKLPRELMGHPKIVGRDEQVDILFRHTKAIAQKFFSPEALSSLFPKWLVPTPFGNRSRSSSSGSSIGSYSRIPVNRDSVDIDYDLDSSLDAGFRILSNLMIDNKGRIDDLVDFCMLYAGLVTVIGSNAAGLNGLRFLSKFLSLEMSRTDEAQVLFGILSHTFERVGFRRVTMRCLAKLAGLEKALVDRVRKGTTHRRPELSTFFRSVLRRVGRTNATGKPIFARIPDGADEQAAIEALEELVDTIEDNGQPEDIAGFFENVVSVIARFPQSGPILELGAVCVAAILPFAGDVDQEVLYECLSVCFGVLSGEVFLCGDNAFAAVEALQTMLDAIFMNVPPETIVEAATSLLAQAKGEKLDAVLRNLEVATENIPEANLDHGFQNMIVFHPEIQLPQFLRAVEDPTDIIDYYERSLDRLGRPETVFEEFADIIESHPENEISEYPTYLQSLFQSMWIIAAGERPKGTSNETWKRTTALQEMIAELPEEVYQQSEFSPDKLTEALEQFTQS